MKKGVVLLITILFIITISTLILKNLDDTEKYIKESNYLFDNSQVLILVNDLKNEVANLLIKHKDDVDEALEGGLFEKDLIVDISNIKIQFNLKKYDKADINQLKDEKSKTIEKLFDNNQIPSYELFRNIYFEKLQNKNKIVESYKQLNDIINMFYERTYNEEVFKLEQILGIIDSENIYELNIYIQTNNNIVAQYLIKNDGKVKYFEISFK